MAFLFMQLIWEQALGEFFLDVILWLVWHLSIVTPLIFWGAVSFIIQPEAFEST